MYPEKIIRGFCRRPVATAITLAVLTAAAALGLLLIPFEGMLETMLPEDSEALRTVEFLRDSSFADKVAISIEFDPEDVDRARLVAELDRLGARFEESSLVDGVMVFPAGRQLLESLLFFLENSGQLLDGQDLEKLDSRITRQEVDRLMRRWYGRLARPEGTLTMEMLQRDPLDIGSVILLRLEQLSQSFGYRAVVENGHLLHPDGRHALLLLDTNVPVTDTVGSRELVDLSRRILDDLPEGFSATAVSGHQRSVSNENVLRSDISRTVAIASFGFVVLFLGIFKDLRAVILFLIPAGSVIFALNLTALLLGGLSYIVIGFGAVIAGIAVDYGIQVYVSMRHSDDPYTAVQRIAKPVVIGALTTLCVFAAFLASAIPGYRQLGVFALISIVLSIVAAMFFLPAFLRTGGAGAAEEEQPAHLPGGRRAAVAAVLILISLPFCAFLARGLVFDADIAELDGAEPHVVGNERAFAMLWAEDSAARAIAVVGGDSYESAAEKNDLLHTAILARLNGAGVANIASLWPSAATREENLERWHRFWAPERVRETRGMLREAGAEYGFTDAAFEPFFRTLERREPEPARPLDNPIFRQLEERFVQETADGYRFLTYFPDTEEAAAAVSEAVRDIPGAFVASPGALGEALSESISAEVRRISVIALILILLVLLLLTRSVRVALAALMPSAAGLMWLFALMAVSGLALNIANMIAGIVVVGLCIDYGIFTVHGWQSERTVMLSIRRAITLSAVTTLMGAGVLVFARHPALFSIGLTLVIGVSAGFIAAVLGVPGLCVLLRVKRPGPAQTA